MEEQEIFEMRDENGVMREARIIDKIDINGQDYLIYALSINEEDYMYGIKYLLYHNLTIKDYFNIDVSIIENCKTFTEKLIYMIKEKVKLNRLENY